jgi:hypothetical protein
MSRPYTKEECREIFMRQVRTMVTYWQNEARVDRNEAIEGMAHSILCMIDGVSCALPAFKLIPYPHPTDKEYATENLENYWPNDIDICDGGNYLHHQLHRK